MKTEKEKAFAAIDQATNRELAILYMRASGSKVDPFDEGLRQKYLPSETRRRVIEKIKDAVNTGRLGFEPVKP